MVHWSSLQCKVQASAQHKSNARGQIEQLSYQIAFKQPLSASLDSRKLMNISGWILSAAALHSRRLKAAGLLGYNSSLVQYN